MGLFGGFGHALIEANEARDRTGDSIELRAAHRHNRQANRTIDEQNNTIHAMNDRLADVIALLHRILPQSIQNTAGALLVASNRNSPKKHPTYNRPSIYPLLHFRRRAKVLIFGSHSADWMTALASDAPVWSLLPEVREVVNTACDGRQANAATDKANRRTVIVPLLEPHILERPRGYPSLTPRNAVVTMLANKARFAEYVRAQGLEHTTPHTTCDPREAPFPCVIKRTDLNGSSGVTIARTPDELVALMRQEPWLGRDVLFQELVAGETEAVTHCVCCRGRVVWHASVEYRMDRTEKIRRPFDDAVLRIVETPKAAIRAIEAILLPLEYDGPCNLDYKVVAPDRLSIFELNPRLGGGLMRPECVALLAGALRTIIRYAQMTPGTSNAD